LNPFHPNMAYPHTRHTTTTDGQRLADRVEGRIRDGKCQRNHHRIKVAMIGRLDAHRRTALALELMKRGYSTPLFTYHLLRTFVTLPQKDAQS